MSPRLFRLPIHRKVLKFHTLNIWFSLIDNNLLTLDYLSFVVKQPLAPLPILGAVFSGLFEMVPLCAVPKNPTK